MLTRPRRHAVAENQHKLQYMQLDHQKKKTLTEIYRIELISNI